MCLSKCVSEWAATSVLHSPFTTVSVRKDFLAASTRTPIPTLTAKPRGQSGGITHQANQPYFTALQAAPTLTSRATHLTKHPTSHPLSPMEMLTRLLGTLFFLTYCLLLPWRLDRQPLCVSVQTRCSRASAIHNTVPPADLPLLTPQGPIPRQLSCHDLFNAGPL